MSKSEDDRRPKTREELVKLLQSAIAKEIGSDTESRKRPTVSGTAKIMNVHRDTLYRWMNEFNVKFGDISKDKMTSEALLERAEERIFPKLPYFIGEALIGAGSEVAHVDLIIGDKRGPVGEAFASSMSNLSQGHTPLLALIRPNLPPKPYTLLIPKVTIKNLEDTGKIFGPAQAAVAKAVADSSEEGVIPKDKLDDWVILCSVFVHPEAKDYRKIYQFNYGATKLAIKRALSNYPPFDKIMYDKDRAQHPIMGFKVPRLWRPPYIQIALDIPDIEVTKRILHELPKSDRIILEAGSPLIKKYGSRIIREIREVTKDMFIVADLKTLDVGRVEVDVAYEETADAVVASGLAANETLDNFIAEAKRLGIYPVVDMMNVPDPVQKLRSLAELPEIVIIHRPIDVEKTCEASWNFIGDIRKAFKDSKLLIAVAGGIDPTSAPEALAAGANIIIVGRYVTQSKDVERAVREFLQCTPEMAEDVDLFRVHVE